MIYKKNNLFIICREILNFYTKTKYFLLFSDNSSDYKVELIEDNFEEWVQKHSTTEDDCLDGQCTDISSVMKTTQILLIVLCSILLTGILIGITILARNHLLKKRISKGPYRVLLTAADFVFPQVPDSRRVSIFCR